MSEPKSSMRDKSLLRNLLFALSGEREVAVEPSAETAYHLALLQDWGAATCRSDSSGLNYRSLGIGDYEITPMGREKLAIMADDGIWANVVETEKMLGGFGMDSAEELRKTHNRHSG